MKLVFVSDIHGSAYYARMLPEIDKRENPERIVLLGDLLYHGPRNDLPRDYAPKEVISILNSMKERFLCVRGNCEAEVDQMDGLSILQIILRKIPKKKFLKLLSVAITLEMLR